MALVALIIYCTSAGSHPKGSGTLTPCFQQNHTFSTSNQPPQIVLSTPVPSIGTPGRSSRSRSRRPTPKSRRPNGPKHRSTVNRSEPGPNFEQTRGAIPKEHRNSLCFLHGLESRVLIFPPFGRGGVGVRGVFRRGNIAPLWGRSPIGGPFRRLCLGTAGLSGHSGLCGCSPEQRQVMKTVEELGQLEGE